MMATSIFFELSIMLTRKQKTSTDERPLGKKVAIYIIKFNFLYY
jgi:hypothetical protein